MSFQLNSSNFPDGGTLPLEQVLNGFGHHGGNVSPELHWHGAPEGTQSFALSMYDRDAPTGSGFWHWVVVDIPASATSLAVGAGQRCSGATHGCAPDPDRYGCTRLCRSRTASRTGTPLCVHASCTFGRQVAGTRRRNGSDGGHNGGLQRVRPRNAECDLFGIARLDTAR